MKLCYTLLFGIVALVCPTFADAMGSTQRRQLEYDLSAISSEEETWGAHADIMREESRAFGRTLGMSFHPDMSDTEKSRTTKLSGSSKRDTKGSGSRRKKSGDAVENSADEEKRTKSEDDTQAHSGRGSLFHRESRSTQPSKASSDVESVIKSKKKKHSGGSRKLIRRVDVTGQRKRMGSSSIRSNAQRYSERKQRMSFWPLTWLSP